MSKENSLLPDQLLRFSRSIRDPIHGTIRLSDEEVALIDQPLFRRLHRIRQNGLLYLVFPTATHTRFEHSLGVLSIVNSAFWSLIRNSFVAEEKDTSAVCEFDAAKKDQAVAFHKLDNTKLSNLLRIARLAGLVHDVGHGPFSHTFDAFAPRARNVAELIEGEDEYDLCIEPLVEDLKGAGEKERIEHEEVSCILFALMWKEILKDGKVYPNSSHIEESEIPLLVSAVILGKPNLVDDEHDLIDYIPLLTDLVASAPVDSDRMDYLERDSRSVGVTYGLYDRERLLKSFLVYKGTSPISKQNGSQPLRLGIKKSGLRAVENFVQARFELFVQIYYHKTNRATQIMLSEIANRVRNADKSVFKLEDLDDFVDLYRDLSDERFLRILCDECHSDDKYCLPRFEGRSEVVSTARRIGRRDLWKRVHEDEPTYMDLVYCKLGKQKDDSNLRKDRIEARATKGLENGAKLLQRRKSGFYEAQGGSGDWFSNSPMMRALAEEEEKIGRIYYMGEDHQSGPLKMLRQRARTISEEVHE